MKTRKIAVALLIAAFLLSGCGQQASTASAAGTAASSATEVSTLSTTAAAADASDMFTSRDYEVGYDEADSALITLSGTGAFCDSDAVDISGSTVTITAEGAYILSGSLSDGMIIVDADSAAKIQLVLDGVSVTSASSAAIYVR